MGKKILALQVGWRENYSLFFNLAKIEKNIGNSISVKCQTDFLGKDLAGWPKRLFGTVAERAGSNRNPSIKYKETCSFGKFAILAKALFPGSGMSFLVYSLIIQIFSLSKIRNADLVVGYARELFLTAALLRKPYIIVQHDVIFFSALSPERGRTLTDRVISLINLFELRRAKAIVVHSNYSRDCLLEFTRGICPPIHVIRPTLRLGASNTIGLTAKYKGDLIDVCFIGRGTCEKGFHIYEELAAYHRSDGRFRFHAFGPSSSINTKEDDIVHHGWVANQELHKFLRRGTVLIFPTLSDGFGIVQYDVLRYGGIVISSETCGIPANPSIGKYVVEENTAHSFSSVLDVIPKDFERGRKERTKSFLQYAVSDEISLAWDHLIRQVTVKII